LTKEKRYASIVIQRRLIRIVAFSTNGENVLYSENSKMAIMLEILAQDTVKRFACSRCWGDLTMTWVVGEDGKFKKSTEGLLLAEVICRRSQKDFGFVTKSFIEKERIKDFDQSFEVKRDLVQMGIITKEKAYGN